MFDRPDELASHLSTSLLDRLRKLAAQEAAAVEKTAANSLPPPPTPRDPPPAKLRQKLAELSPEQVQERRRAGCGAVQVVADSLWPGGAKVAAAVVLETMAEAAKDLETWAPASGPALESVVKQAGLAKTASGQVQADYVGRLLLHGTVARLMQKRGQLR